MPKTLTEKDRKAVQELLKQNPSLGLLQQTEKETDYYEEKPKRHLPEVTINYSMPFNTDAGSGFTYSFTGYGALNKKQTAFLRAAEQLDFNVSALSPAATQFNVNFSYAKPLLKEQKLLLFSGVGLSAFTDNYSAGHSNFGVGGFTPNITYGFLVNLNKEGRINQLEVSRTEPVIKNSQDTYTTRVPGVGYDITYNFPTLTNITARFEIFDKLTSKMQVEKKFSILAELGAQIQQGNSIEVTGSDNKSETLPTQLRAKAGLTIAF